MVFFRMEDRMARLPRKWSNCVLKRIAPFFKGKVINVSGWDDRDKEGGKYREYFSNCDSYSISNYKGERGEGDDEGLTDCVIDLSKDLENDLKSKYDVVLNHTTLEHIYDVQTAFSNLCQLTSNAVIVVVPFAQVTHSSDSFGDYWRFCPMLLRQIFFKNGFSVIYESSSPYENAGIYLLFVATCKPEEWLDVLPAFKTLEKVGDWIGNTFTNKMIKKTVIVRDYIRSFFNI